MELKVKSIKNSVVHCLTKSLFDKASQKVSNALKALLKTVNLCLILGFLKSFHGEHRLAEDVNGSGNAV